LRFELANMIFASTPVPYHANWSAREHGQPTEGIEKPHMDKYKEITKTE
jgi:hypothetical protein